MKRATDDELRAKLAGHPDKRPPMTIEFPEVGYEVAFRAATPAEYRAGLDTGKQPSSATRFSMVAACLLFPDVPTFNDLADKLPAIVSECAKEIDDAGGPGEMQVFDLNEASLHRLSVGDQNMRLPMVDHEAARALLKAHRALKGVIVRAGEPSETHFVLKPPPRATYEDTEDAKDIGGVMEAAERAFIDCACLISPDDRARLLEQYPGIPVMLIKEIRALGGDGVPRKKARRVV